MLDPYERPFVTRRVLKPPWGLNPLSSFFFSLAFVEDTNHISSSSTSFTSRIVGPVFES
jgi:hypothetical protein